MTDTTIPPIPEVGPAEARRLFALGAVPLDVREPDEFASGHVAGARLIPLGLLPRQLGEVPRDRPVVVVCRSGRRSGEAVRLLQQAGFDRVFNLAGGILAWDEAGLPREE